MTWIWREGWHLAPPPCSSRAEPSAGAGLTPPSPGSPCAVGLAAPGDKCPTHAAARSLLTHQGLLHPWTQLREAQRVGAADSCHPQPLTSSTHPVGRGEPGLSPQPRAVPEAGLGPDPRSPGAARAWPRRMAPAPQLSAAPRCCQAAAAPACPSRAEGWAGSGAPSLPGCTGVLRGFWLRRTLGCTHLPKTAPTPGAGAGPAPGQRQGRCVRAARSRLRRGSEGGRTDSASPSASATRAEPSLALAAGGDGSIRPLGAAAALPRGLGLRPLGEVSRCGPTRSTVVPPDLLWPPWSGRAGQCAAQIVSAHRPRRTSLGARRHRAATRAGGSAVGLLAGGVGRLVSDKAQADVVLSGPQPQPSPRPSLHPPSTHSPALSMLWAREDPAPSACVPGLQLTLSHCPARQRHHRTPQTSRGGPWWPPEPPSTLCQTPPRQLG